MTAACGGGDTRLADALPPGVDLRPAVPADCARVEALVAELSLDARFHRFFVGMSQLPRWQARLLCGAGGADVLVATAAGAIVGHIMVADTGAPDGLRTGDVGVMVAERWRRQGVGAALLRAAAVRAAGRGVGLLTMDVMGDNRAMLDLVSRLYPGALRARNGPVVHIQVRLASEVSVVFPGPPPPGLSHPARPAPRLHLAAAAAAAIRSNCGWPVTAWRQVVACAPDGVLRRGRRRRYHPGAAFGAAAGRDRVTSASTGKA
jgi:GNAT superfamily N-acetyltransferase